MSRNGFGGGHRRRSKFDEARRQSRQSERRRHEVRSCCETSWREEHLESCQRSTKCRVKVAYAERRLAKQAAAISGERWGCVISEYRCPDCGLFHIGNPRPGERRSDEATS